MASNLNRVSIMGNLVRDSVLKTFDNGGGVLNFSIAVNHSTRKGDKWEDETFFFDASYFSKGASSLSEYLVKGKPIIVDGYLKQETWEKDGKKNSAVKIVADNIYFCGSNKSEKSDKKENNGFAQKEKEVDSSELQFSNNEDFPEDIPF